MPRTLEQLEAALGGATPLSPEVRECPDLVDHGPNSKGLILKLKPFGPHALPVIEYPFGRRVAVRGMKCAYCDRTYRTKAACLARHLATAHGISIPEKDIPCS